ncbi:MAG: class I SAM-dependent methyltransferase [Pseudomonadota bacterium]
MDWTHGYVQTVDYTHHYCRELSPSLLDFACLSRGISTSLAERPLRYLELGFGQGLSLNVHAAASQGEFWGTDFIPAHVLNARELAAASRSGARLFEDSFEDFARREDLPEFDVIGMHGTWSWISPQNRAIVLDIVRKRLAPGGLFYLSYNALPGCAAELPLRNLLKLHVEQVSPPLLGVPEKIDASLSFMRSLAEAGSRHFHEQGESKALLDRVSGQNRNYLAHEYLNRDWQPMGFAEVAALASEAKLEFATSATLSDHLDSVAFPDKAKKLLDEAKHPLLRETARDYLVNQRFRRDIFVKGLRRLSPEARDERFARSRFVLRALPEKLLGAKIPMPFGEAELKPETYGALSAALAEQNFAPKSLTFLRQHPGCKQLRPGQFVHALRLLVSTGHLHLAQSEAAAAAAAPRCQGLNAQLLDRALYTDEGTVLASPVTGSGVIVPHEQQLFLHARAQGQSTPAQWAAHAWSRYSALGVRLTQDGKVLETAQENLAYLTQTAQTFADQELVVLQALGIA